MTTSSPPATVSISAEPPPTCYSVTLTAPNGTRETTVLSVGATSTLAEAEAQLAADGYSNFVDNGVVSCT